MEEKEQLTPQTENTAAEVAPKPAENMSPATEDGAVSAVAEPAAEAVTPETKVEEKAEAPKAEEPAKGTSALADAPKAPEKGSVSSIVFYSIKSEEGVRKALEAQGVKAEDVISVELVEGRYVAKIKE